ncbi:MAG: polyprenyl synthetase family protein, partial [Pseudomonadota bacterium]
MEPTLARAARAPAPPRLAEALGYAVLPGGARVRPQICLAVARACGDPYPRLADAAAAAIELIHCASLAHDDLPCFDNADLRRGKPSLHRAYGEPLAVLTGDTLIVSAFETLAAAGGAEARDRAQRASGDKGERAAPGDRADEAGVWRTVGQLVAALGRATGAPQGICAGQAWESEPQISLDAYHAAKTGALFVAATEMGALAAGQEPERWRDLGARIGAAFQIADDLKDAYADAAALGKPTQQDAVHGRPNAVAELGLEGAVALFKDSLAAAISSVPSCPGEAALCALVRAQAERLTPALG